VSPRRTDRPCRAPAVLTTIQNLRAEGGVPGVASPDEAILDQAETSLDTFEENKC